ncbi:hypothetical protein EcWSU1_02651 [Enterobacter ludwigii]|uniref:Uncharacterized protein n=1 Tax=Enterobacter ludwigii TaxID=299767 RepID=G8LFA1_9ENTR|nr:hypothetical protein EcWSU1_02651 [Enterobacter ludwigii]
MQLMFIRNEKWYNNTALSIFIQFESILYFDIDVCSKRVLW